MNEALKEIANRYEVAQDRIRTYALYKSTIMCINEITLF
jgi:hypothetical protein